MKFTFDIELTGLDEEKQQIIDNQKKVLWLSMNKMHDLMITRVPVDTGRLKNSININPKSSGFSTYTIADGVKYGVDIEYGTSPHFVDTKDLEDWAGRKLGDKSMAGAVQQKIAERGTNAQPFFRNSIAEVKSIWLPYFWNKVFSE